jgi:hypothetical protein
MYTHAPAQLCQGGAAHQAAFRRHAPPPPPPPPRLLRPVPARSAGSVDWFASECRRVRGDVLETVDRCKRMLVLKQPVGVVAAICPWNFPMSMITRKVWACSVARACGRVLATGRRVLAAAAGSPGRQLGGSRAAALAVCRAAPAGTHV